MLEEEWFAVKRIDGDVFFTVNMNLSENNEHIRQRG